MTYETATILLITLIVSSTIGGLIGWYGVTLWIKHREKKR